jgi:hypothetical protein
MAKNTAAEQIHEAQIRLAIERATWLAQQTNQWSALEKKWAEAKAAEAEEKAFEFWCAQQEAKAGLPW